MIIIKTNCFIENCIRQEDQNVRAFQDVYGLQEKVRHKPLAASIQSSSNQILPGSGRPRVTYHFSFLHIR